MTTSGDRIKHLIESQGYTIRKFCMENDIHYQNLTAIINGKRPLGMNVMMQLKQAIPSLDAQWILFGEMGNSVVNYDTKHEINKANEPTAKYAHDPFENLLANYLQRPVIQNIMEEKIKKVLTIQLGDAAGEITIKEGKESSPMLQKLEEIVKRQIGKQGHGKDGKK